MGCVCPRGAGRPGGHHVDARAKGLERAGDVIVAPPVPVRRLSNCRPCAQRARYMASGWVIRRRHDAATPSRCCAPISPVVQDARRVAPQPPPFVDERCDDPSTGSTLIPVFAPAAPAFRAIFNDRHRSTRSLRGIAAYDSLSRADGLAESLEERWVVAWRPSGMSCSAACARFATRCKLTAHSAR